MIDTSDKNFNINLNINIKNIRTRYQYQYQYCRIQNSISISIPIPKMIKFKLNLKTIPRYLDILRSQANTQKIRAGIAQLWPERFCFASLPGYSSSRALTIALVLLLLVRLRNSVIEHIVEAQRTRERDGKQLYHIIKPTGPTSYSTGTHAHWAAEIFGFEKIELWKGVWARKRVD